MNERFKQAEDEYWKLRGQLGAGRITDEQFKSALKERMIQDAQGRYWSLSPNDAKWYVNDGQSWSESDPSNVVLASPSTSAPATAAQAQSASDASTSTASVVRSRNPIWFLLAIAAAVAALCCLIALILNFVLGDYTDKAPSTYIVILGIGAIGIASAAIAFYLRR